MAPDILTSGPPLPVPPATRPSERFVEGIRRHGVLFILPTAQVSVEDSYYWSWCLAAGLQDLAIPVQCNLAPALERRGITPTPRPHAVHDDTLVVADLSSFQLWERECRDLAAFVLQRPRRTALLCLSDIANNIDFPPALPAFTAHSVARIFARGRRIPWAFGLSRDILDKIAAARSPEPRTPVFLRNFRPSANQTVRNALDLCFVKPLAERVTLDMSSDPGGLWKPDYFARLARAFASLAYGGVFAEDLSSRPTDGTPAPERRILCPMPVIDRWDSWRFWESLASGCLTVALDFDEYGFQIPVLPTAGIHYIGLKLHRLEEALTQLAGARAPLAQIAENGRQWALTHYAPAPIALRFLATMEHLEQNPDPHTPPLP